MSPGVALWLAHHVATPPDGLLDLATHWDNLQASLKKKLPANTLIVNRKTALEEVKTWLRNSPSLLTVECQSPREVVDVFTAWVTTLPEAEQVAIASRSIIVQKADAWQMLVDSNQRLILICTEQLDLDATRLAEAYRKGHHVLLPISPVQARPAAGLRLDRLNRFELGNVLREAGLPEQEAFSLAQQSGGSFTVLRRQYSSVPVISMPHWGRGQDADELAPLLLVSAWQDKNPADQAVIAKLTGKSYEEARKVVARWNLKPDAPIRWANGTWEFLSPLDAWTFLYPVISPNQLDTFEEIAREVLGVDDPRYDLPPNERWLANIKGKQMEHSFHLRNGMARTLALLATRTADQITDTVSLQTRVTRVVSSILPQNASWRRWASLGDILPLVAEAAPEAFLDTVEAGLRGEEPEIPKLFAQEGAETVTGRIEHSGLLWALERLAWSEIYLSRVSIVLAKFDEHDPGGRWTNRPKASLRDVFFSWMPHTSAPLSQRLEILQVLLSRHSATGWKLVLELLPQSHSSISLHNPPEWRFWAERWVRGVTVDEHRQTLQALTSMALTVAEKSPEKWIDLFPLISDFRGKNLALTLEALDRVDGEKIPVEIRKKLWELLRQQIQKHRYYSKAAWAFPEPILARLDVVRARLQPAETVELTAPLFNARFEMIGDEKLSWEDQEKLRLNLRIKGVQSVIEKSGFDGVLQLVKLVKEPYSVGMVLAESSGHEFEGAIIPALLCNEERPVWLFAESFAAIRIHKNGRDWAESLPLANWKPEESATFAAQMPFDRRTWELVARLGPKFETEYWVRTRNFPYNLLGEDIERAARKFIEVGRPLTAINLLALTRNVSSKVAPSVLLEILEQALGSKSTDKDGGSLDAYHVREILSQLQQAQNVDEERLAQLEWLLLPMLDHDLLSPVALNKHLARKPAFFIEILTLLFRPRHAADGKDDKGEPPKPDEATLRQAERAWKLLHNWRLLPGTKDDGSIESSDLQAWVSIVREKAAAIDRLEVCDSSLGEMLAFAPAEADGSWPCIPVRDLLERVESKHMEQGFATGIFNKRGIVSKNLGEGGLQERGLAEKFEGFANQCQTRWPRTAAALMIVVADYKEMARQSDAEADAVI